MRIIKMNTQHIINKCLGRNNADYSKFAFLKECKQCGGNGHYRPLNSDKDIKCSVCEGTGYGKVKE